MSNQSRSSKILLIVLFLGMISFPLVMSLTGLGRQSEQEFLFNEFRLPNSYPALPRSTTECSLFPRAFESAFNDQIPWRNAFNKLYGKLCVRWMNVSPRSQLLLGKNGHCYLASHMPDRSNSAALFAVQIKEERIAQQVAEIEIYGKFLESLPIPAVMVSLPTSHILDFKNLPDFIQQQADPTVLEAPQAMHVLQRVPQSIRDRFLLYPYERIRRANEKYPLYADKNFHWHQGRYTRLMASCIAEHFGIAPYEEPSDDEFKYETTVSDLNQFACYKMKSENTEVYRPEVFYPLGITEQPAREKYPNLPDLQHTLYTINPNREHCILVVGESFTPMLNTDLARYFGEVISVNYNMARMDPMGREWLKVVVNDVQPDYIVFLHHQIFKIFDEFMTDYRAVQPANRPIPLLASEPLLESKNPTLTR